jgi:Tfp pilus assembly protein FimT
MRHFFSHFDRGARGTSLLELVVLLGIVALLSSMLVGANRAAARRAELARAAQILQADIRKAQSYAVSARPASASECSNAGVYYGVRVATNNQNSDGSYRIFADCNTDWRFNSNDTVLATTTMSQVYVRTLSPSPITIVYAPPHPTTRINNSQSTTSFTITLCHRRMTSLCMMVSGNTTGNVEIQ